MRSEVTRPHFLTHAPKTGRGQESLGNEEKTEAMLLKTQIYFLTKICSQSSVCFQVLPQSW